MAIQLAVMIEGQEGLTWARWEALARAAEESGYAGLYRSDHLTGLFGDPTRPSLDGTPGRPVAVDYEGPGSIETYTVSHSRDGEPERAFLAVRTPDGARAWAATTDADFMDALEAEELLGRPVTMVQGEARC